MGRAHQAASCDVVEEWHFGWLAYSVSCKLGSVQQDFGSALGLGQAVGELHRMLKLYPPGPVEDAIRKEAADLGIPITQYLAPFLKAIADKQLMLTPQLAPILPTPTR